ncbi:MAG TPA: hypothetical protein DEB40_00955 [Elusimicrobia bacterium]|nr:hypothetical protein [Elusimicrobiota bacterium]HBT60298.1 hypothetical protein [Elusimicrobiota bacterium]
MKKIARLSALIISFSLGLSSMPLPAFSTGMLKMQAATKSATASRSALPVNAINANLGGNILRTPLQPMGLRGSIGLPQSPLATGSKLSVAQPVMAEGAALAAEAQESPVAAPAAIAMPEPEAAATAETPSNAVESPAPAQSGSLTERLAKTVASKVNFDNSRTASPNNERIADPVLPAATSAGYDRLPPSTLSWIYAAKAALKNDKAPLPFPQKRTLAENLLAAARQDPTGTELVKALVFMSGIQDQFPKEAADRLMKELLVAVVSKDMRVWTNLMAAETTVFEVDSGISHSSSEMRDYATKMRLRQPTIIKVNGATLKLRDLIGNAYVARLGPLNRHRFLWERRRFVENFFTRGVPDLTENFSRTNAFAEALRGAWATLKKVARRIASPLTKRERDAARYRNWEPKNVNFDLRTRRSVVPSDDDSFYVAVEEGRYSYSFYDDPSFPYLVKFGRKPVVNRGIGHETARRYRIVGPYLYKLPDFKGFVAQVDHAQYESYRKFILKDLRILAAEIDPSGENLYLLASDGSLRRADFKAYHGGAAFIESRWRDDPVTLPSQIIEQLPISKYDLTFGLYARPIMTLSGGNFYITNRTGVLKVDGKTGAATSIETYAQPAGAVAIARPDLAFVAENMGMGGAGITAFNPATGKLLGAFPFRADNPGSPVPGSDEIQSLDLSSDGTLAVGTESGLVTVRVESILRYLGLR